MGATIDPLLKGRFTFKFEFYTVKRKRKRFVFKNLPNIVKRHSKTGSTVPNISEEEIRWVENRRRKDFVNHIAVQTSLQFNMFVV